VSPVRNRMQDSRRGRRARLGAAALVVSAFFLAACNIVGPAAYVIGGPDKVDARHTLPDVPTVVFVDDPRSVVNPVSLRRTIADTVSEELMINKLVTTTISSNDAMVIASRSDRASKPMSAEEIGRAVGAQQVVLVKMTQFQNTPDGYTPRPFAAAEIKVIDLNSRSVWPEMEGGAGFPLQVTGAPVDPSVYAARNTRLQVFESLGKQLGDQVAKLFYKHDPRDLGGRVSGH